MVWICGELTGPAGGGDGPEMSEPTPTPPDAAAAPALSRWPIAVEVPVAWGDMDAFGHVNNTVYLRWFETARIAYFERLGLNAAMAQTGVGPILARVTCDFRLPVAFPDTVTTRVTVTRLGRSSFVMDHRVESAAFGGRVAAEGEGVIVLLDYRAGRKVALDDALRGAILALESEGVGAP